jgi:hypothetical protein
MSWQKRVIITLVFKKKKRIFRRKLGKIAENSYHNIGFQEKPPFFRLKSLKIVITLTPDWLHKNMASGLKPFAAAEIAEKLHFVKNVNQGCMMNDAVMQNFIEIFMLRKRGHVHMALL